MIGLDELENAEKVGGCVTSVDSDSDGFEGTFVTESEEASVCMGSLV